MFFTLSDHSRQHIRFGGRPNVRRKASRTQINSSAAPAKTLQLSQNEKLIVDAVFGMHGVAASHYRETPLARRMGATLRSIRAADAQQAVEFVCQAPEAARQAINALLIGYTLPFRDASVFHSLYKLLDGIQVDGNLRIWSVACSSGLELYSLALMLADLDRLDCCELVGTDVRTDALREALDNRHRFWNLVPDEFIKLRDRVNRREFEKTAGRIQWRMDDVLNTNSNNAWDIILCRNLAIYLSADAGKKLWSRLAAALVPGGTLVTGKAEQPYPRSHWERIDKCIFQRI